MKRLLPEIDKMTHLDSMAQLERIYKRRGEQAKWEAALHGCKLTSH